MKRSGSRESRLLKTIAGTGMVLLLAACAARPPKVASYRPMYPQSEAPAARADGSIFRAGHETPLFEDIKARRVGDILTIVLSEKTDASKTASTSIIRDDSVDIENPTLLGSPLRMDTPGLPHAGGRSSGLGMDLSSSREFTGEGDSSQGNSLSGNITVTVSEVLPNGNLVVRGEKWLTLNQGDEYIRITGIVRPVDIGPGNTVLSSQVADARITYSGRGALADANRMGWLSRFFLSVIWPF